MPRKSHERLIIFTRYPEPGTVTAHSTQSTQSPRRRQELVRTELGWQEATSCHQKGLGRLSKFIQHKHLSVLSALGVEIFAAGDFQSPNSDLQLPRSTKARNHGTPNSDSSFNAEDAEAAEKTRACSWRLRGNVGRDVAREGRGPSRCLQEPEPPRSQRSLR